MYVCEAEFYGGAAALSYVNIHEHAQCSLADRPTERYTDPTFAVLRENAAE